MRARSSWGKRVLVRPGGGVVSSVGLRGEGGLGLTCGGFGFGGRLCRGLWWSFVAAYFGSMRSWV